MAKAFSGFLLLMSLLLISTQVSLSCGVRCAPSIRHGSSGKCPKDTLKFGVCGSWLGLVKEIVGTPPSSECCTLVQGLADLEAAACFCSAIKANVLGVVKVEIPVAVSTLVNGCGKKIPQGFVCP